MLREGLLGQWAEELNLPLRPEMVTPGSHRMVWWRCEHGHVWRAAVYSRSVCGTGCPVCAGKITIPGANDLASQHPGIASEWAWELNGRSRRIESPHRATAASGGAAPLVTSGGPL